MPTKKIWAEIALETDFGTYWTILEKSIFLPPKKVAPPPAHFCNLEGGGDVVKNRNNFFFSEPIKNSSGGISSLGNLMISPGGICDRMNLSEVMAIFQFFRSDTDLS